MKTSDKYTDESAVANYPLMTAAPEIVNDPNAGMPFVTEWNLARHSDNPDVQRRIIAEQLGIPESAVKYDDRHGWYYRDGNKFVKAQPYGTAGDDIFSQGFYRGAADIYSKPGAMVGGTIGGMTGNPIIAAAGAAGGDLIQTGIEEFVEGNERPVENYLTSAGKEFGASLVGDFILSKGLQLTKAGWQKAFQGDEFKFSDAEVDAAWQRIEDARKKGINLTVAEAFGDREMNNLQAMLRETPGTSKIINDELRARYPHVEQAINDYVGNKSVHDRYSENVELLDERLQAAKKTRSNVSGQYYNAARNDIADIQPVLDYLDNRIVEYEGTKIGRKMASVRRSLLQNIDDEMLPKDRVGMLHAAKVDLDDLINAAHRKGRNAEVAELMKIKDRLVNQMLDASDLYRQGKDVYQEFSYPVNQLERDNLTANILNDSERPVSRLGNTLFGPQSSPEQVAFARAAINNDEKFTELTLGYLKESLNNIRDLSANGEVMNIGGRWAADVFGSQYKRELLKTALPADQYQALVDLTDILSATGQSFKGNSNTAMFQVMRDRMTPNPPVINPKRAIDNIETDYVAKGFENISQNLAKWLVNPSTREQLAKRAALIRKYAQMDTPQSRTRVREMTESFLKQMLWIQPAKETADGDD